MIQKTRKVEDVIQDMQYNFSRAHKYFREIPFPDFREECLKAMRRASLIYDVASIRQLEEDIAYLASIADASWQELLLVYTYHMKATLDHAKLAYAFVMSVCSDENKPLRSKAIRGLLPYHPENFPVIQAFLHREVDAFLTTITPPSHVRYSDSDWHQLTRAIETLVEYEDGMCVTRIDAILEAFRRRDVHPGAFLGVSELGRKLLFVQHQAYLHEALRQMKYINARQYEAQQPTKEQGAGYRPS